MLPPPLPFLPHMEVLALSMCLNILVKALPMLIYSILLHQNGPHSKACAEVVFFIEKWKWNALFYLGTTLSKSGYCIFTDYMHGPSTLCTIKACIIRWKRWKVLWGMCISLDLFESTYVWAIHTMELPTHLRWYNMNKSWCTHIQHWFLWEVSYIAMFVVCSYIQAHKMGAINRVILWEGLWANVWRVVLIFHFTFSNYCISTSILQLEMTINVISNYWFIKHGNCRYIKNNHHLLVVELEVATLGPHTSVSTT